MPTDSHTHTFTHAAAVRQLNSPPQGTARHVNFRQHTVPQTIDLEKIQRTLLYTDRLANRVPQDSHTMPLFSSS